MELVKLAKIPKLVYWRTFTCEYAPIVSGEKLVIIKKIIAVAMYKVLGTTHACD